MSDMTDNASVDAALFKVCQDRGWHRVRTVQPDGAWAQCIDCGIRGDFDWAAPNLFAEGEATGKVEAAAPPIGEI